MVFEIMGDQVTEFIGSLGWNLLIIAVVIIWLKGMALWKAARLKETGWFWVLLIVNSLGILPGIYLYIRRKRRI